MREDFEISKYAKFIQYEIKSTQATNNKYKNIIKKNNYQLFNRESLISEVIYVKILSIFLMFYTNYKANLLSLLIHFIVWFFSFLLEESFDLINLKVFIASFSVVTLLDLTLLYKYILLIQCSHIDVLCLSIK